MIAGAAALEIGTLALAFAGLSKNERRGRSLELLDKVGLSQRADHLPSELSGGEQQRVSIARAIANEPQVLLADEPTGNLDSSRAAEVMGVLEEMRRRDGKTVVLVTHDRELADRFATRVIRLKDGKVITG